jgi:hypothetical protein
MLSAPEAKKNNPRGVSYHMYGDPWREQRYAGD